MTVHDTVPQISHTCVGFFFRLILHNTQLDTKTDKKAIGNEAQSSKTQQEVQQLFTFIQRLHGS